MLLSLDVIILDECVLISSVTLMLDDLIVVTCKISCKYWFSCSLSYVSATVLLKFLASGKSRFLSWPRWICLMYIWRRVSSRLRKFWYVRFVFLIITPFSLVMISNETLSLLFASILIFWETLEVMISFFLGRS